MVVGELNTEADLLVIGGGPGGYTAALRAAQLGRTVTLVERDAIGGVCLNVGCIPSKALIELSARRHDLAALAERGVVTTGVTLDFSLINTSVHNAVQRLTGGVQQLLRAADVDVVSGDATFAGEHEVRVQGEGGTGHIRFRDCIVATGSVPRDLPGVTVDHSRILDSTDLLFLSHLPESLVVIGGGYIGIELGTAYARLGSRVTIVEALPRLLAGAEPEIERTLARSFKSLGVEVVTSAAISGVEIVGDHVEVALRDSDSAISAELAAVAVGRVAKIDEGFQVAGIELDPSGRVFVDQQMRTTNPHIYAIGDIAPGPMLAHKAYYEAKVAAEAASGQPSANDAVAIPAVVFSSPEVAMAGLSAEEAAKVYGEIVESRFPYRANGRAVAIAEPDGEVKIVSEKSSGRIVGVHIVGADASNLIGEGVLAIELGASLEDLALTIHPHPTLTEMFVESAEVGLGRPTHLVVKR